MKKTNIAKRIVSVLLAMSIVLSFALVSVSAMPADLAIDGTKVETYNFEDGINTIFKGNSHKSEIVEDTDLDFKAHSGTHLIKFTKTLSGGTTPIIKIWPTPNFTLENNSHYYLSFWQYSTTYAGLGSNFAWNTDNVTVDSVKCYPNTAGTWNKTVIKFTTGDGTKATDFAPLFWDLGDGDIYIDDVEIAKVTTHDAPGNPVPAGGNVEVSGTKDFENKSASGIFSGITATAALESANSARGQYSCAVAGGSAGYFIATGLNSSFLANNETSTMYPGIYYFSYYAYSPDAAVTNVVQPFGTNAYFVNQTIPQGQWTKISGTVVYSDSMANIGNSRLFNFSVGGTAENTVYFDDFMLARLSSIDEIALSTADVKYYFADKTAKVTIASNIALKSAEVKLNDAVVPSSIDANGNVVVNATDIAAETNYTLSVAGTDAFDRAVEKEVSFTTPKASEGPMKIAASSIEDGATNVIAPVSYIYIDAPYALKSETVVAGNFTITGRAASVTAVELVDTDTIKVSLANVLPENTYTLAVDNVANTDGGILTDSIEFTTTASAPMYSYNMEGDEKAEYLQKGHSSHITDFLNTDKAHSGTQSIKTTPLTAYYNGYSGMWINGLPRNNAYQISFYINSDAWVVRNNGTPLFDEDRGDIIAAPVVGEADANGWRKVTVVYMPTTIDGALMVLQGLGENPAYIDDIEVIKVAGTIAQPVIIAADGSYDDAISAGAKVEIPVAADVAADAIKVFVVQYGENNKMISATPYTNAGSGVAITFTVPDTANKTKVIIMNATTYAPLCDAYAMNY